ncbi:hypothetical protein [Streptomyces sp. NPDC097640]|uniref:hypothetical protein n=1 Tax=Streptomyces sp. NPDC097640 TaxID=3157229 RepID=UPI00331ADA00
MDYPYISIGCRTGDGESSAGISLQILESGVEIDEGELVALIRTYLEGLPGVVTSGATRFSVAQEAM